ncbi:hypothetical protein [Humisphaera borealis]|uniref:Uncharacterized protein n=1 Tax=Humisphaera borealis TaxID=2807512 RepID=A0A7M2WV89_9BACT|nr:hypothetical protein [Humisphaera borealis]QOV89343.1 hypothetical protein IPV69_24580 [Humisphaera borealis]
MVHAACEELFNYATDLVTQDDVAAFAPNDPGYPNYVREWLEIRDSRSIPLRTNFEITETVGLTRWVDADAGPDSDRFRRFRVFTNAVALGMSVSGRAHDDDFPPNYTLISLMDDAAALQDAALWRLLLPAFEEAYAAWTQQRSREALFGLLALLLVHAHLGTTNDVLAHLAERLIEMESGCPARVPEVFLFGCTCYDQLNDHWKRHIHALSKSVSDSLSLVRAALLDGGPADAA